MSQQDDVAEMMVQAVALHRQGRYEEAQEIYAQVIAQQPRHFDALHLQGVIAAQRKDSKRALELIGKALEINPNSGEAHCHSGITLKDLQRVEEAIQSYDKAIAIKPDYAEAHYNRGIALKQLRRFEDALQSYDQAIALKPEYALARLNKSLTLLLRGNFSEGWTLYEWRFKCKQDGVMPRSFSQPRWLGKESLAGKSILLHAEQGLGDTIQFCRYAKLVKALGATVILEVPNALMTLLEGLEGVDVLLESGMQLPSFDYQCPLLSLPLAFNTELNTIPGPKPYLHANAVKSKEWTDRLGEKKKPRVGLVWSGKVTHKGDCYRSLSLDALWPFLPQACEYVSLQKEVRETDSTALARSGIQHFGDQINDFSDTAALCDLMDVVVSVDTSVAHLAASIGKTTWVLLPSVPDWRWLLNRDDSPWYESIKLYRQGQDAQWATVIDRVAKDLSKLS